MLLSQVVRGHTTNPDGFRTSDGRDNARKPLCPCRETEGEIVLSGGRGVIISEHDRWTIGGPSRVPRPVSLIVLMPLMSAHT